MVKTVSIYFQLPSMTSHKKLSMFFILKYLEKVVKMKLSISYNDNIYIIYSLFYNMST